MKKIAFITGASSGIGRDTALLLAGHGYHVFVAARHVEKIPDFPGITPLFIDLTDDRTIVRAVESVLSKHDSIDVLVNDAGYGFYGTLEDVPLEQARREMEVNLFSIARLCQLFLPSMRTQSGGKIVNISSVAGRMTTPLGGWYHASKFALEGLSAALRQEVAPFGIDVILIEPGIIDTPWWEKARRNLESVSSGSAYRTQIAQWKTVLQIDPATSGHPMEVARVILKALAARKPQTRYAVGGNAEGILMARKLLSDHAFDHAVDTLTKTKAREGENRKGSNDRE